MEPSKIIVLVSYIDSATIGSDPTANFARQLARGHALADPQSVAIQEDG